MLLCAGSPITPDHLGLGDEELRARQVTRPAPRPSAVGGAAAQESSSDETSFGPTHPDRAVIEDALKRAGGVVSKAALEMGISRQAFYRRMDQVGMAFERRLKVPR
jgi:DNA-binding NtrC family response regulator